MTTGVTCNPTISVQLTKKSKKTKVGIVFGERKDGSVKVMKVEEDGIASKSLQAGDTILAINEKPVKGSKHAMATLATAIGIVEIVVAVKGNSNDIVYGKRTKDPKLGKTRFCVTATVDIRKDPMYVQNLILRDLSLYPCYHPEVRAVDFKDPNKTSGIGAVRTCHFYQDSTPPNPEFIWEQVIELTNDRIVMCVQEKSRPPHLDYIGPIIDIVVVDDKTTRVIYSICFAPKFMPFTRIIATTMMKDAIAAQVYRYAQALKYHCETEEIATNKIYYPEPFLFKEIRNIYDLHDDHPNNKIKDPLAGQTRFCTITSVEIRTPIEHVTSILWDLSKCPLYHPFVESTEFQDPNKTSGTGAARKCKFYSELGDTPEYVWEEFLDMTNHKIITFVQEENRPSILDFIGKVYKLEEINSNWTRLVLSHVYRPKYMPLTRLIATSVMKKAMGEEIYSLAQGIKYHCETGETARYESIPIPVKFKEVKHIYDL